MRKKKTDTKFVYWAIFTFFIFGVAIGMSIINVTKVSSPDPYELTDRIALAELCNVGTCDGFVYILSYDKTHDAIHVFCAPDQLAEDGTCSAGGWPNNILINGLCYLDGECIEVMRIKTAQKVD